MNHSVCRRIVFLLGALCLLSMSSVFAQTFLPATQTDAVVAAPTQADINELVRLLGDERIAEWLREQAQETGAGMQSEVSAAIDWRRLTRERLQTIRQRAHDVGAALKDLPSTPQTLADTWLSQVGPSAALRNFIYVLIFLFVGGGAEWLFWQFMRRQVSKIEHAQTRSLGDAMRRALTRGGLSLAAGIIFALGCVGSFISFQWPPMVADLVLDVLIAAVVLRSVVALGRFVLAPRVDALRLVPLSKKDSRRTFFWMLAIATVATIANLASDTFATLGTMGTAEIAVQTLGATITAGVVIAGIFWGLRLPNSSTLVRVLLSVLVLVLLVLHLLQATQLNLTLLVFGLLLPVIWFSKQLVDYFFDRAIAETQTIDHLSGSHGQVADTEQLALAGATTVPAADDSDDTLDVVETSEHFLEVYRPAVRRLVRFLVVIAAVLLLSLIWGVPLWGLSADATLGGRLVGAAVDITVAILIADLVWSWARTVIDRRINAFPVIEHGTAPGPEARMATLLPLFRKTLWITVVVMVLLIALSSLGVNVGPLIAGAGVIGIAIGFGAQALVRDIVSGIFYLIDDAFRVGEYIELGDLRGTVESMSVRSLRLRHHRGAVHTIPFGELSSLTNHSRDWVIVKMEFRVPFDTDLKVVKKLVKKVAAELQDNPDYGHHLIEPLKSQGVRRMEEFNMVVGVKFMTKPGEQWTIRRDAYQKIRDAFDANGLAFAARSVKVEVIGDQNSPDAQDAIMGAAHEAIDQKPIVPAAIPDEP